MIPGLGRSPGEGNENPLQYSCLENPRDRGSSPRGCKESHATEQLTVSLLKNISLFLAVQGLHCCVGFFLVAVSEGCSPGAGMASHCSDLVAEPGLSGTWASVVAVPGLESTGSVVVVHGLG